MFQCAHLCLHTHALSFTCNCRHMFNLCFLALAVNQLPTGILVALCTFKHTHAHAHKPTCTQTHMHMYTHYTGVMLQSQTCAYAHIKIVLAVIQNTTHTHTHTHTHTLVNLCWNYYLISLLSLVAMCTFRCEPALQECTLMHTGMHAQARTLTQTNTHT